MHEPLSFRFRWVNKSGNPGLFSHKAVLDEERISLGGQEITYDRVHDSTVRDDRLILQVDARCAGGVPTDVDGPLRATEGAFSHGALLQVRVETSPFEANLARLSPHPDHLHGKHL